MDHVALVLTTWLRAQSRVPETVATRTMMTPGTAVNTDSI